jgi:chromosome segregation protein
MSPAEFLDRLAELQSENDKLKQSLAEERMRLDDLATEANGFRHRERELTGQIRDFEDALATSKRANTELGDSAREQRQYVAALSLENDRLRRELGASQKLVRQKERQLAEAMARMEELDSTELKSRLSELSTENDDLRRQVSANGDLSQQLEATLASLDRLTVAKDSLEVENKSLKRQVKKLEANFQSTKREWEQVQLSNERRIEELETQLGKSEQSPKKLRAALLQVRRQRSVIADLEGQVAELEAEIQRLREAAAQSGIAASARRDRTSEAQRAFDVEVAELKETNMQMGRERDKLMKNVEKLREENEAQSLEISDLRSQLDSSAVDPGDFARVGRQGREAARGRSAGASPSAVSEEERRKTLRLIGKMWLSRRYNLPM